MLPYVALGYFAAGFLAGFFGFATIGTWIYRVCFVASHENLARIYERRGETERAMHVRANVALFQARWREEDV